MTDRKQARAMDLPGYPCPPSVRDIPNHAGSWGWVTSSNVAQDDRGYLWVKAGATPKIALHDDNGGRRALVAWSETGLSLWVDPRGYVSLDRVRGDTEEMELDWVPVAVVLKEQPGFTQS